VSETVMEYKTRDFWYDLPEELIAQTPLEQRDSSRLLVMDRESGKVEHKHFFDIIDRLRPGDCLVMNDSRVLPARLLGHRPTGGAVEVLLLRDLGDKKWECLCKPGRKMQVGHRVIFGNGELTGTVTDVLEDGNRVESVVMYYKHGITICISCQVGCRMGCKFCASTIGGLVRSLSPGEILDQIIFAVKDIGERISNIVMMGIGEPLDNYNNVIKFLRNVNDENGINIGYRHISLSTCGLVPKILELMKLEIPLTLSISLHAPTDDIRKTIMPVNNAYSTDELIAACREYASYTKRRISFEYALIHGVNDSVDTAQILAKKLKGMLCHVNLIPVNKVEESGFEKPSKERINKFMSVLEHYGITVTVRRELGSDINASCGQLRRKESERKE